MLGMEMMLSNLIGKKPEELKRDCEMVIAAITEGTATIQRIEQKLDRLLEEKETVNGGRKRIGNGSSEHVQL